MSISKQIFKVTISADRESFVLLPVSLIRISLLGTLHAARTIKCMPSYDVTVEEVAVIGDKDE